MKNEIYERDYSNSQDWDSTEGPREKLLSDQKLEVFSIFTEFMRQIPKVVLPKEQRASARLLKKCDT